MKTVLIMLRPLQTTVYARRPGLVSKALFALLWFFFVQVAVVPCQTLEIVLLDGRSGKPVTQQHAHVNAWVGKERKAAIVIPTDKNGVAMLELTQDAGAVNIPDTNGRGSIVVAHP